jgi:hypothetical protein
MKSKIDHIAHGWALLAVRTPEIRALSGYRQSIGEMCECYSIAVLHLRNLQLDNAAGDLIEEHEMLVSGIEQEVAYYLTRFSKMAS